MTLHEEWTDKLSDYLDGELARDERDAVESHLRGCVACARVLEELEAVAARARALEPRPPLGDLWPAVAARIDSGRPGATVAMPVLSELAVRPFERLGVERRARPPRRISFTLPQLAAASLLIAAISGAFVWSLRDRAASTARSTEASRSVGPGLDREAVAEHPDVVPVSLADAQYDAAVADLEKALQAGRGRLDPQTITIVEHNLQTIDEAIRQAREALAADPANTYLSGHLVEARRRKLDLLRRATELTSSD